MSVRVIAGIVAIACCSICGILSTILTFEMVDKVNEKLPEAEQFGQLGWYLDKKLRLNREYKRLYPDGRLLFRTRVLMAFGFVSVVVAAWGLGFFLRK